MILQNVERSSHIIPDHSVPPTTNGINIKAKSENKGIYHHFFIDYSYNRK